jgi:3D (Asp-Asp-Asp) domain-containing protein
LGPVFVAVLSGALVAAAVAAGGASTSVSRDPSALGLLPAPRGYRLNVDAVAYHLPGRTASGVPVGKGIVAVDPKLIPLGTSLYVPGYGKSLAADVGTAIKGRIIDLWMPTDAAARKWGRRTVTITVYH